MVIVNCRWHRQRTVLATTGGQLWWALAIDRQRLMVDSNEAFPVYLKVAYFK